LDQGVKRGERRWASPRLEYQQLTSLAARGRLATAVTTAATAAVATATTAAAATAAEAATATAAAAATFTLLRLVHLERTAAKVLAVQGLHGALRVGLRHLNEAKATRLARVAVIDQGNRIHGAMSSKQLANGILRRGKGQIAHIQLSHNKPL
jgi:uncharacterized MAPEG superfamily protein